VPTPPPYLYPAPYSAPAYPAPYGYPGYPPYPGHPPPPPPDPEEGWNGFAIASLVLGCIGAVLFSVTFGIIALIQTRRSRQRGRGLAIGGLALSGLWALGVIALIAVALVRGSTSDASTAGGSGVTISAGHSDESAVIATGYTPGDCVDDIDDYGTMHRVDCTPEHDGEIFAVFTLPNERWPGEDELAYKADARCYDYLQSYTEHPFAFESFGFYPSRDAWPQDRSVVCVAYDQEGSLWGSIHH
jgi:hypothetical protein